MQNVGADQAIVARGVGRCGVVPELGEQVVVCTKCGSGTGTGVVAPVFVDFVGKSWEAEYPVLLGRYYDSLLGYGGTWVRGDGAAVDAGSPAGCSDGAPAGQRGGAGVSADGLARDRVVGGSGNADEVLRGHEVGSGSGAVVGGVGAGEPAVGYAETLVSRSSKTEQNRAKREKKRLRKVRKQGGITGSGVPVGVKAVGIHDVATREQLTRLAEQRAQLYELENERKILKMQREIMTEKVIEESGANVQRVNNWISDVKSGSTRSSGAGWASRRAGRAMSSGSWRSRVSTASTPAVSDGSYKAVVKRVAELEAERVKAESESCASVEAKCKAEVDAKCKAEREKVQELERQLKDRTQSVVLLSREVTETWKKAIDSCKPEMDQVKKLRHENNVLRTKLLRQEEVFFDC